MSGMLHPVGPEPARTYWIRRGILSAVVLVLAVAVVAAVASLTKAAVATAPPPVIAVPAGSPSATPTAAPTGTVSTGTVSTGTASTGTAPGTQTTPAASQSGSPQPSGGAATAASAASTSTAAQPSASAVPTPKPTPTTTVVGTPDCRAGDLRVSVKGDRTPTAGKKSTFTVRLTNRGDQTCLTSVTAKNFELKIFSGKDRIWSSRDCSKSFDAFDKVLADAAQVAWTVSWNGKRSVKGTSCRSGDGTLGAGTYWATAQLTGAKPVQLRMTIG